MNRLDLSFKIACQQWHARFLQAKADDANALLIHVKQQLKAWVNHHNELRKKTAEASQALTIAREAESSARLRIRMLEQLHYFMGSTGIAKRGGGGNHGNSK